MSGIKLEKINWDKLKTEALRLKDFNELKKEVEKVKAEIKKFNINDHLNSSQKKQLKALEKKYTQTRKNIDQLQTKFDREFNKGMKLLQSTRKDAEKKIKELKKSAKKHRKQVTKASKKVKKKVTKKAKKVAKKTRKKKSVRKSIVKKTTTRKKKSTRKSS